MYVYRTRLNISNFAIIHSFQTWLIHKQQFIITQKSSNVKVISRLWRLPKSCNNCGEFYHKFDYHLHVIGGKKIDLQFITQVGRFLLFSLRLFSTARRTDNIWLSIEERVMVTTSGIRYRKILI